MRVGFLSNQIDNRGTGNALFDYAHYNETILKNKSYIFTLDTQPRNALMEKRLLGRFGAIYYSPAHNDPLSFPKVDVLYHIKYGLPDQYSFHAARYVAHAVFDGSQPHGDRYAAISEWLGQRNGIAFVPHIISLARTVLDLRADLGIPYDAIVFGRHGGRDTFDIPFAWDAINKALVAKKEVWFVFLNTDKPNNVDFYDPNRVIFLEETGDPVYKRKFINTCDAMLHARGRGETFGIAVGEFSVAGKQIITYGDSPEKAHIEGGTYLYYNEEHLLTALLTDWRGKTWIRSQYKDYTPKKVMKKFKAVFLEG